MPGRPCRHGRVQHSSFGVGHTVSKPSIWLLSWLAVHTTYLKVVGAEAAESAQSAGQPAGAALPPSAAIKRALGAAGGFAADAVGRIVLLEAVADSLQGFDTTVGQARVEGSTA